MQKNLLFLGLLFVYNFLFWEQAAGINLVIFSALIILLNWQQHRPAMSKTQLLLAGSYLCAATSLLLFNSQASLLTLLLVTISWIGYMAVPSTAILQSFLSGFLSFFRIRASLLPHPLNLHRRSKGVRYASLSLIPLLFLILYSVLFSAGNPVFKDYSQAAFGNIFHWFEDFQWGQFFFLLLGVFILRWGFMRTRKGFLKLSGQDKLQRRRKRVDLSGLQVHLKREYISAIILFVMLNLLFAIVNFIDVKFVWFHFHHTAVSLKDFLHEGFYWLILSLLISIGLVLYFFRANLNFYPENKPLKILAEIWIAQNMILAFSVALRGFYYIKYHGLATGRVIVLVFLALVFFGLVSLMIKVWQRKNFSFLIRTNSAFALVVFSICALVNWDVLEVKVNLSHGYAHQVDVDHYLDVDPQAYPIVWAHLDKVEEQIRKHNKNRVHWISYDNIDEFRDALQWRTNRYLERREKLGLYSWTYADTKAVGQLQAYAN